ASLYFGWGEIEQGRRGPTPVAAADLRAAKSLGALPSSWVTITPTKIQDTGVRRQMRTNNGVPLNTLEYALVKLDDRYLIVECDYSDMLKSPVTGHLSQSSANDDIAIEVGHKVPACHDKLLPFQMTTKKDQASES